MKFSAFARDILADLNESQRAVALDEVTSILGLGETNVAVIAGAWKARALHFEKEYKSLVAMLSGYFEGQEKVEEYHEVLRKLREQEDVLTEHILASDEKKAKAASRRAKAAANALHDKPNGTREKREAIRALWASGNYSSRDLCAEQECAALNMSPGTARKALRNTPEPPSRRTA